MKLPTITFVSEAPVSVSPQSEKKGKVEKKAGKRVGYNYIIIKSYKESQKNDVVKCLYIKSLTNFGFCVIKEGTVGDTKDKHGRDVIDRLKWQQQLHQQLQGKLRLPRLLGHFAESGNYYLVIEHIKGNALQKVIADHRKELRQSIVTGDKLGMRFINYLIQITELLDILHSKQIVHRDATPNNYMVMPNGKVALIDMEMCYSLRQQFPTPAFQLGTYGYMSKQQEQTLTPTTAEDIFALGAIIFQIWSGVSPGKVTNEPFPDLKSKVELLIPDKGISQLTLDCLHPEDHLRPSAKEVGERLQAYKADLKGGTTRILNREILFSLEQIKEVIQESIQTFSTPLLAEEDKGWFSNDLKPAPKDDKHRLRKQWYASYNRGAIGIVYMLAQAKKVRMGIDVTLPFIEKGLGLVNRKYITQPDRKSPSLHYGSDGIAAALAVAIETGLIQANDEYLEWIDYLLSVASESVNITYGMAGQGIANMVCRSFIGIEKLQARLQHYSETIISRQDPNGSWTSGYYRQKFTKRKIKKITLGFSEGMAGVIFFLLEFGYTYKHTSSIRSAEAGLSWLIRKAQHKHESVQWLSSTDKELNYGWSNGIAGIALTFIKAYDLTKKEIYKEYASKALLSIPAKITDSNIGQLSGLSGLGEIYLEAYKVFGGKTWFERAGWIAQLIICLKKQHPQYGCYWLVEHERQPVGNFMVGNSGVIHFLLRYCFPDKIGFPLMPQD